MLLLLFFFQKRALKVDRGSERGNRGPVEASETGHKNRPHRTNTNGVEQGVAPVTEHVHRDMKDHSDSAALSLQNKGGGPVELSDVGKDRQGISVVGQDGPT